MRRWNGWGEQETHYPLPESALQYLFDRVGQSIPQPDASLESALAGIPSSRFPLHPLLQAEGEDRLRHARGQSLPDWVALRSGRIGPFPDAVAHPEDPDQIRSLLEFAQEKQAVVIPYGGGTSVVGHINPLDDPRPTLTMDLRCMNRLLDLDKTSRLARIQAGATGPQIEAQLNPLGYTLGHFPQSWEQSTLGGWIATRSAGQQSLHYGRIEDLVSGLSLETLNDRLSLPPLPASAAGPDLLETILGSEGRLGIITEATVKVRPLPERERFLAAFFPHWESGVECLRSLRQEGIPLSMLRLNDPTETETTLALSGQKRLVDLATRGLSWLGYRDNRCLMIYGLTGTRRMVGTAYRWARAAIRAHKGLPVGPIIGDLWRDSRFRTPYLRNTLWEQGYALDTLETALPWSRLLEATAALQAAMKASLQSMGERGLVFSHLSHLYPDGVSLYTTFLFRRGEDPDETLERWGALKTAGSQCILRQGGTISHQHGVGVDHAPYLSAEKGEVGLDMMGALLRELDPGQQLNPGKLLGDGTVSAKPGPVQPQGNR